MRGVLSREQAREFDRHAVALAGFPSLILMENAGRGATELLLKELARSPRSVVVVAGPGNNGGDGFVLARRLRVLGHPAEIWLIGDPKRLTGDALSMWQAYQGLYGDAQIIPDESAMPRLEERLRTADVVVDALFGTGLSRPIEGLMARAIEAILQSPGFVFALDIPSGLDANRGRILGTAARAQLTASFGHAKLGQFTSDGADCCGRLVVVDIGVPSELCAHTGYSAERLEADDLRPRLVHRRPSSHKGRAGRVAVVAGHAGTIGSAILSARGALRMGAGLVTHVGLPETIAALELRVTEAMTRRLDPTAIEHSLTEALRGMDSVVLGPGLGRGELERRIITTACEHLSIPIVVDADALSVLAEDLTPLLHASGPRILLPHRGELARLLRSTTLDVDEDPFVALDRAVELTNAILVLKGAYSFVAAPGQKTSIVGSPCAALGTGGSGDVLAGVVAALAVDQDPLTAALLAVHLHGRSGRLWVDAHGLLPGWDRGLIASDIADNLPEAVAELARVPLPVPV